MSRGETSKLVDKWGYFTPVPEIVIESWRELGTDAVALFVYLRYRTNRKREDDMTWPSYATIREDTGLTFIRISRALKALVKAGFLDIRKRFGESNAYTLTRPAPVASPSDVEGQSFRGDRPVLQGVQTNLEELNREEKRGTLPSVAAPALSGIQEHPSPERAEAAGEDASSETGRATRTRALALAEVCGIDFEANRPRLLREAKLLAKATPRPTPDEIRGRYGAGGWWGRGDWRGRKGERPTLALVRETWGAWSREPVRVGVHPGARVWGE